MPDPKAPKQYTPEYCDSMVYATHKAMQDAVEAINLATDGQDRFTRQAIEHINEALMDGTKSFLENRAEHQEIKKSVGGIRTLIYTGAISALILYVSSQWAILQYIVKHLGSINAG